MSAVEIIIAAIAPFLYIVLLTGFFVYVFKKKYNFQTILPIALISTVLFVFLFTAVFHNITFSFWITVLAALAFFIFVIFDKGRVKTLRDKVFTPGFVVFCIVYLFVLVISWFKVIPLMSDSSMHWAPHVWAMWLRNDFYTSPGLSIVIHGDYPPAVQLFELLWSKAAGIYHEGLLFIAISILGLSMLFPALSKLQWSKKRSLKDWLFIFLLSLVPLILPLILFVSDFYASLEVDSVLAFIFSYGIYLAIFESRKFTISSLVKISLVITFLCLTKQIAILLAGLVVLTYISGLIFSYRKSLFGKKLVQKVKQYFKQWKLYLPSTVAIIALLVMPLICIKVWSAQIVEYTSPDRGVAVFHLEPTDTLQIPEIITGDSGSEAQQNFSRSFIKHVLFDPGGLLINNAGAVSYAQLAILFIGAMIAVWFLYKESSIRRRIVMVTIIISLGWLLYCFAIYATFLFGGMNTAELNNVDTPNRYLRTYLLTMLLIVALLIINRLVETYSSENQKRPIVVLAIALIALSSFLNQAAFNATGVSAILKNRAELASLNMQETKTNINSINSLTGSSFKQPTKILITAVSDNERHYLQYNALPSRISLLFFESNTTQELVCSKLANIQYLVIGNLPKEENRKMLEACFENNLELELNGIYKLNRDGSKVSLEKVN